MTGAFRVSRWVKPYRLLVLGAAACALFSVVAQLAVPALIAQVIDRGITAEEPASTTVPLVLMAIAITVGTGLSVAATAIASIVGHATIADLRRDLYTHILSFSFGNLDELKTGRLLTNMTSDTTKVLTMVTLLTAWIVRLPILFLGSMIGIIAIEPSMVGIIAIMVPIIAGFIWYIVVRSTVLFDIVQKKLDRLNTVLQENIAGARVIKAYAREEHQTNRFNETADDLASSAIAVNQLIAVLFPTLILITNIGIAVVLWSGGIRVMENQLSEGELVAFITYLATATIPLMMFAFVQPILAAGATSMNRLIEVFDETPRVEDPAAQDAARDSAQKPTEPNLNALLSGDDYEIVLRDVSFNHRGAPSPALCDINLRIGSGKTFAILGATGAGKSTLVHLIARFYDPTSGTISIEGPAGSIELSEIPLADLRAAVAIALQEPQLFAATVAENLRYGDPTANLEALHTAADGAQASEFISTLPDRYDSEISQGGSNLSGGQRQRMALARTFISNSPIIILDDSTSAVDIQTEIKIQDYLSDFTNNSSNGEGHQRQPKTVILVAQRISTALGADEIILLDAGRVAGQGTHDELIESNSIYRSIYESQLGSIEDTHSASNEEAGNSHSTPGRAASEVRR